MGTKDFNIIDNIIAYLRLNKISKYLKKDSIVLDFGCGNQAYFLNHIKNKIKEGIGLDYDVKSQKVFPNVTLIQHRFVDRLPFSSNRFTQVYMLAVLEHLETNKVNNLFQEFKRILKKNGQIILTTPTPLSQPVLEFLAFRLNLISKKEVSDHKKYYLKSDIVAIAKSNKLKLMEYKTFQLRLNSYVVFKKNE